MQAEIAIIGGSGFYAIEELGGAEPAVISTPYGDSAEIVIGEIGGRRVAFVPRHGRGHGIPPHLINYRANMWALHELGVERVLASTASGSLNPRMRPGDLALIDQFIDFTRQRPQTFYEGGEKGVAHIDITEPYCPELRELLRRAARKLEFRLHPRATYGCTEGPRLETAAEIRAMRKLGCDLVGMTNVPECVLARELEMCYAALAMVTNFAAGISKARLAHRQIVELMRSNAWRVKKLLFEAIAEIPRERSCECGRALEGAFASADRLGAG